MNATATPLPTDRPRRDRDLAGLERLRWAVRAVLMLGVAASVAANVLHARPNLISQLIAAWPPLALMLTVELISRVPADRRGLATARLISAAIIAGIAAWVSYWHMVGVAARYGETSAHADYLLPLSVDGLVVVASISLVEIAGRISRSHHNPAPAGAAAPAAPTAAATTVNDTELPPAGDTAATAGVAAGAITTRPSTAAAVDLHQRRDTTAARETTNGVTPATRAQQPPPGHTFDPHQQPSTPDEDRNGHRQPPDDTDDRDGTAKATQKAAPVSAGPPVSVHDEPAVSPSDRPDGGQTSAPAPHADGGTSARQDTHPQPPPAELDRKAAAATMPTHNGHYLGPSDASPTHPESANAPDQTYPRDASDQAVRDAGPVDEDDPTVPSDTAAAVAYWHRRDPEMHPADIAARIARSERTVRRYWPPRPAPVNGDHAHSLADQTLRP
jgi:hypothetical protein